MTSQSSRLSSIVRSPERTYGKSSTRRIRVAFFINPIPHGGWLDRILGDPAQTPSCEVWSHAHLLSHNTVFPVQRSGLHLSRGGRIIRHNSSPAVSRSGSRP